MARPALRKANSISARQPVLAGALRGDTFRLGPEVGAGGEGIVYAIAHRPEVLAKVYRRAPSPRDIDKLRALVRSGTPELLGVTAWPLDCLKSPAGTVVGFLMSRIQDARGVHELYSPRGRVRSFPSADFRFLVHVATNVARLFASVHKAGFIIGDVNHGNILVRNDGTVAAIDCDSFQVGDGSRFPCRVGIELFTPPELLGHNLGDVRRTPNHDAFGLAVLVFHLLFMGRHPFAGRYLALGEMPIEQAIAEYRFAYSREATRTKMSPPPYTLPLGAATPAIAGYFERAFHPDGRRGGRPTPEDWMRTLEALKVSLADCASVAWHQYPPSVRACPWCEIERASGAKLYGGIVRVASAPIADLEALWARYLKLTDPGPAPPLPREVDWTPPADRARSARRWRRVLALATSVTSLGAADVIATINPVAALAPLAVGGLLVVLLTLRLRPAPEKRAELAAALARAEETWQPLVEDWRTKTAAVDFASERRVILAFKVQLDALSVERAARLQALAKPVSEAEQRLTYLAQFRIEDAGLFNIGAARPVSRSTSGCLPPPLAPA